MSFINPLIYFILANGLFVYISKKTFGKCLPLTMMVTAFTYFFSQILFKTFKVGYVINLLFAVTFIVILIYSKATKKDQGQLKNNFFTKGFYSFLLMYLCVYIFDLKRSFSVWDEFSHWGVMIKEMFRLDKFYSTQLSTLMVHKDYPPIIQLFEMFFSKLSGGYSEYSIIKSIHLLSCVLFIPSFCENNKKYNKKNFIIKTLLIIISIFLVILFFDQHGIINTIYTDYILAIIVVHLFSIIIFEDDILSLFNLIRLSVGCSFLVLTKQIALPLYMMILFIFIIDIIFKNKSNLKEIINKKNIIKIIKIIILIIIIPLLCWKGWNNYVEKLDIEQQFKLSDLKLIELKGILTKTDGQLWQQTAAENYINAIETSNMTNSYIKLSYFQCLILTLLILYILFFLTKKIFYKEKIPIIAITLILGYIGYAFVMLVMYSFSFGSVEGPSLASFNRYLPTYVIICMLLLFSIFVYIENYNDPKCKSTKIMIIITSALLLIQSPSSISKIIPKLTLNQATAFESHAINIKNNVEENSKIFIIAQNSTGDHVFYIKYYMDSLTTNLKHFNLPVDNIDNYESYFNDNIKDYMLEFDYLYLAEIDDKFIKNYNFIFEDNLIEPGKLYKINKEKDNIKLSILN